MSLITQADSEATALSHLLESLLVYVQKNKFCN